MPPPTVPGLIPLSPYPIIRTVGSRPFLSAKSFKISSAWANVVSATVFFFGIPRMEVVVPVPPSSVTL